MQDSLNNYRLKGPLKPLAELPEEARETILDMAQNAESDSVDKATAVLLWALISNKLCMVAISRDNLNKLIDQYAAELGFKTFPLSERRGSRTKPSELKTLYACLTGRLLAYSAVDIMIPQDKSKPGVFLVIDQKWKEWIGLDPTEDEKLRLVEKLKGRTYKSYIHYLEEYNLSRAINDIEIPKVYA